MDSPITAAAKQLQKAWEQTINAVAAGRAAKGVVEASCRIEFCPNDHIYLSEWDVEPDISKLFANFVRLLDASARRYLSREGITLAYDIDSFYTWPEGREHRHRCGFSEWYDAQLEAARGVSLVDLGTKLSAHLAPENARQIAITQAADFIFNEFRPERGYIKDDKVIESRGDRRIIHTRIWNDSYDSAWKLSHSCIERICKTIKGFQTLLDASSSPEAVSDTSVNAAIHALQMRGYSSRWKLPIGPQVELLFFKEKLEYIFSSEAMNALQVAMQSNRTIQQKDAA